MESQNDKLRVLLSELEACCESTPGRAHQYQHHLPDAERVRGLPLVHAVGRADDLVEIAAAGALRSQQARFPGRSLRPPEELLGFGDCVYTSLGHLYPDANVALIFSPTAENESTNASPWDTATFASHLCPDQDSAGKRACFERYSLPAPEYRTYFVHYVSACYGSPDHYMREIHPCFPDPVAAMSPSKRLSRFFEVRFERRLAVDADTLVAVLFLRSQVERLGRAREVSAWLRRLNDAGVRVEGLGGASTYLAEQVRTWILRTVCGL